MSYDGPGEYLHYKGGTYTVLGVAEHESTGQKFVIYESHAVEHNAERLARGADLIARPLDVEDALPAKGEDPWNSDAVIAVPGTDIPALVTRFRKVQP